MDAGRKVKIECQQTSSHPVGLVWFGNLGINYAKQALIPHQFNRKFPHVRNRIRSEIGNGNMIGKPKESTILGPLGFFFSISVGALFLLLGPPSSLISTWLPRVLDLKTTWSWLKSFRGSAR